MLKKITLTLFIISITAIILLSYGGAHALGSKPGGFSINMPGKAVLQKVKHDTFAGDVEENTYTAKTKGGTFSVSYTVLPGIATTMSSDGSLVDRAKSSFVKKTGAEEVSFTPISFGKGEAKELAYKQNGKVGKARFYVVDKMLYVVAASGAEVSQINAYLNSFRVNSK